MNVGDGFYCFGLLDITNFIDIITILINVPETVRK